MKQQLRFVNEAAPRISDGVIRGVAAVFNRLSNDLGGFREIIKPGAFDRSLREIAEGKRQVDARIQHEGGLSVCGTTANGTLRLFTDDIGLNYEITPPDTTFGKDLTTMVRDGYLRHSSFAFECGDDQVRWNWKEKPPVVEVMDVDLIDVAPCSRPAYDETTVAVRSMISRAHTPKPESNTKTRVEMRYDGQKKIVEFYLLDQVLPGWMKNYFPDIVTAGSIVDELGAHPDAERIEMYVNSPGGDVFEGISIYNTLKNHPAPVHVNVIGMAASIAGVIAMAGDHIQMGEGSFLMVHNAWTGARGNAMEMRNTAKLLDKIDGSIAGILANRSGAEQKQVLKWMADETWFTASEAVDAGLADRISPSAPATAGDEGKRARAMGYRNIPSILGGPEARHAVMNDVTLSELRRSLNEKLYNARKSC